MERYCTNCKHYEREPDPNNLRPMSCYALAGKPNPVREGEIYWLNADMMRLTLCGWSDPKLWEPKR